MEKEPEIEVLVVEPGKAPYGKRIKNELKAMQEMVGGYIEPIYLGTGDVLIANEEGKLLGLEGNRRIGNDIIAGTFFIAGDDGSEFCSLSKESMAYFMERFQKPEQYTEEEVADTIRIEFYSW